MKLKNIGIMIVLISVVFGVLVYSYTQNIMKLREELHKSCPLPTEVCPIKRDIPHESVFGIITSFSLLVLGLNLFVSSGRMEKNVSETKKKLEKIVSGLGGEEKSIYEIVSKSDGAAFQSDIIEKSGFSKVKVSRVLDRLEMKNLVERRRRGMSNIVVLKQAN